MSKPDWTLIGALVALEVIPYESAEMLEKLYNQREFVLPINVSEALNIAIEVFGGNGDDDSEPGEEEIAAVLDESLFDDEPVPFTEADKFDPPAWFLIAHERWHNMIIAGEIENDCAE